MGRSARWIHCHINSTLPSKANRRNNTNSVLWWVRSHSQKQQFILFSLFRHLRHSFRCYLSLELLSSRNKQKALTGLDETHHQTADAQRFSSSVLSGFRSANKGFITSINRYTEGTAASGRFAPEFISRAGLHSRDMLSLSQSGCSTCFKGLSRSSRQAAIWAVQAAQPGPGARIYGSDACADYCSKKSLRGHSF